MTIFQAYCLLIKLANFLMEHSAGRVILIGVPPRHDGTNESSQKLNSLPALDKGLGYKFIGIACSLSYKSVLPKDRNHLETEGKSNLKESSRTRRPLGTGIFSSLLVFTS